MADVVELRPDPDVQAHAERIRFICWLVDRSDLADDLLRRGLALAAVFDELHIVARGTKRPGANDRQLRRLIGSAGSRRRQLPKNFGRYSEAR